MPANPNSNADCRAFGRQLAAGLLRRNKSIGIATRPDISHRVAAIAFAVPESFRVPELAGADNFAAVILSPDVHFARRSSQLASAAK